MTTSSQGGSSRHWRTPFRHPLILLTGLWMVLGSLTLSARAALQFDVFLGYDELVREANWFPVACEIFNDGPTFTGVVELSTGAGGRGQIRRFTLELPTHTRKRFAIPAFGSGGRFGAWNARLLDQYGRVRAEHLNLKPRREVSWETVVLGALPRTFGGLPTLPEVADAAAVDGQVKVTCVNHDIDLGFVAETLVHGGVRLTGLWEDELGLEEVFLRVTKGETQ